MSQDSSEPRATRRQVLRYGGGIAAATATALAGCSSASSGSTGPFKNIAAKGSHLVVEVSSIEGATVNFIPPDGGDPVFSDTINAGQSQIEIPLVRMVEEIGHHRPLPAGTYTLVAVDENGNTLGKQTVELSSDVAITDVGVARGSAVLNGDFAFTMTLTNTGNLPARVKSIGVPEGVPNPMQTQSSSFRGTLGSLHNTRKIPGWKQLMVVPGETVRYESLEEPFLLSERNFKKYTQSVNQCVGKQRRAVAVVHFVRGGKITQPFTYTMHGDPTPASGIFEGGWHCGNISASVVNDRDSQDGS